MSLALDKFSGEKKRLVDVFLGKKKGDRHAAVLPAINVIAGVDRALRQVRSVTDEHHEEKKKRAELS